MLRNLPKVTQQRFKPGFLCNCKTASVPLQGLVGGEGGWGKALSVPRKRALASLDPGFRKDEVESWRVGESADPREDERHVVEGSRKTGLGPEAAPPHTSVLLASP